MASNVEMIVRVYLGMIIIPLLATGSKIMFKDVRDDCPSACKCRDQEISCNYLPTERDFFVPKWTKLLIIKNAISCEDKYLDRLKNLIIPNQIKIIGKCSKPSSLAGRRLSKLIENSHSLSKYSHPAYTTSCNFDIDLCGWTQLTLVDFFNWTRISGSTTSSSTGPTNDHTLKNSLGYYLYTESSWPRKPGEYADLMSPPLATASNSSVVEIKFYYHAYGSSLGKLQIYAMYPRIKQSIYPIKNVSFYSLNSWRSFSTTFRPLHNPYRVIIRGVVGSSFKSDIAIDDIFVSASEKQCYTRNNDVYRGSTSTTQSGLTCQSWSSQYPHSHPFTPSNYSNSDLISNYCRNPGGVRNGPWCYTISSHHSWEYCNIQLCASPPSSTAEYPLGVRYPVALVNLDDGNLNVGRVVIYHNGRWGTICKTGLSNQIMGLFCQQAGLGNSGSPQNGIVNNNHGFMWLDSNSISCSSNATSLIHCFMGPWGSTCGHTNDLWLMCSGPSPILPPIPSSYQLSLRGGYNYSSGRIDVNYNGQPGIMCSTSWDIYTADVVCRQLGYVGAYSCNSTAISRPSGLTAKISYIRCNGYEPTIDGCTIATSNSICQSSNINVVSCRPGSPKTDNYNEPEDCSFQNGFCGWTTIGPVTWIWYPNEVGHFNPFSTPSDIPFLYVYRPSSGSAPISALLTSPLFTEESSEQYITFDYIVTGTAFDYLEISYKLSSGMENIIYQHRIDTTVSTWTIASTDKIDTDESFTIKIMCRSVSTSTGSVASAIGIRRINFQDENSKHGRFLNIPGIAVGCAIGIIIIIFIILYVYKRSQQRQSVNTVVTPSNIQRQTTRIINSEPSNSRIDTTATNNLASTTISKRVINSASAPVTSAAQSSGVIYPAPCGISNSGNRVNQFGSNTCFHSSELPHSVNCNVNPVMPFPMTSTVTVSFTDPPPNYEIAMQQQNNEHETQQCSNRT
ncbi:MAM and LDL-receptor class A domain-containing protein 2 [Trichoplax sp. H2]|nr:MAM and LDL-receptor class A domain-containing protein 2 [Trichoplax sp. H2]|eukprot:RDD37230.1 MAM and LDL-receptor class A domain-containing protein 2 [Trichoplax sp. H2]